MSVSITYHGSNTSGSLGRQIGDRRNIIASGDFTASDDGRYRIVAEADSLIRIGDSGDDAFQGETWAKDRVEVRLLLAGDVLKVAGETIPSLSAPTLNRITGSTTYPPMFDIGLPAEAQINDVIVLERSTSVMMTSPITETETIDAGLLTAGTADFGLSAVTSGSVYFRAYIARGGFRISEYSTIRNVGDAIAPVITAPASDSSAENATFAGACTTDEYAALTITGDDGAMFEVTSAPGTSHTFRFVGGVQPDYEAPTDANTDNVYDYTLNAVDPAGNMATPVNRSVTITDIYEYVPMTFSPLPANKQAYIALSNGNKTATSTPTVSMSEVRANQARTGKRYYEFSLAGIDGSGAMMVGVASADYTGYSTVDSVKPQASGYAVAIEWVDNYTQILPKAGGTSDVNTLTIGTSPWSTKIIQLAVDETARKAWFGINDVWVGDPAAGTGGQDLPASGDLHVWISASQGNAVTLRTTTAEYTQTKPAGFSDGDD